MLTIIYGILQVSVTTFVVTAILFLIVLLILFLRRNKHLNSQLQSRNSVDNTPSNLTEEKTFNKEIDMAKRVQQGLLETTIDAPEGLKITRRSRPAETIGGDFYTFINKDVEALAQKPKMTGVVEYIDKRQTYFGLCLGDVAGHGVSSALVMALTSGILSEITWSVQSPATVLKKLNMALKHYLENSQVSYVTAFYSVINMDSKTLSYAKAGHPPGYILKPDGDIQALETEGVILGMFDEEDYDEKTLALESKDRLIFYTDGLIESETPEKEMFGFERLQETLVRTKHLTIEKQVDAIFNTIAEFSNHIPAKDDQTMVIIEIE